MDSASACGRIQITTSEGKEKDQRSTEHAIRSDGVSVRPRHDHFDGSEPYSVSDHRVIARYPFCDPGPAGELPRRAPGRHHPYPNHLSGYGRALRSRPGFRTTRAGHSGSISGCCCRGIRQLATSNPQNPGARNSCPTNPIF